MSCRIKSKSGSILIMTAAAGVFLLGILALVTDVGWLYYNSNRLQSAVNAGWKAGFDEMAHFSSITSGPLDEDQKAAVRTRVLEVMKENGYSDEELSRVEVHIGPTSLDVSSRQSVGLFFARVMNFNSAEVFASRVDRGSSSGIVPLAIPNGVVKDLSKTTYTVDFFDSNGEFVQDREYILKLGSGNGGSADLPTDDPNFRAILVPMGKNDQSGDGYLRAYGAAFWCLKIDESDSGYTPVEWLLGYRGGSFVLPYDAAVLAKLREYSVNYEIIQGSANMQAIYDAVNPNVLDLYMRPRIAVYSSQDGTDPVEDILRAGKIPYGTYALPPSVDSNGWTRNEVYNANRNNHIYDGEIIDGVLSLYHWVHLHHEDFTGFNGGCSYWSYSCKDHLSAGHLGSTSSSSSRATAKSRMCSYCSSKYNSSTGQWAAGYTKSSCANLYRRCAEKTKADGSFWRDDTYLQTKICMQGDDERPQCREYNRLRQIAAAHGFTSDAGSEPKPQYDVKADGTNPIPDNADGWFNKGNLVQKMKWTVARAIKAHVEAGGFLFAQCFAPETLDLALWQAAIHDGKSPNQAYDDCLAFTDFHYKTFPIKSGATWFSSINTRDTSSNQIFDLNDPIDPRCQNHGTGNCCDTGSGHTAGFITQQIKSSIVVLGDQTSTWKKYIKGECGQGNFTFLGGHYHNNIYTKRLVLNNVLLGSLVKKEVVGGSDVSYAGKQKNNYGAIDPDNYVGGGANDYRDRLIYGFNGPIQMGDRLIPEPGNMAGPTVEAVDARINGLTDPILAPNRHVILAITDIPPEVAENNPLNASATAIYDLQGQDHPNGVYASGAYNFGAAVRVIGFAEFEILAPEEYTRSGTSISFGDEGDLGLYQPGQVRGKFVRYIVKPGEVPVL